MKLKIACEIGKECELFTLEEAIRNIELHANQIFNYDELNKELFELEKEYNEIKNDFIFIEKLFRKL